MTHDLVEAQLTAIADTRKLLKQFEDKLLSVMNEREFLKSQIDKCHTDYDALAAEYAVILNALKIARNIIEDRIPQTDDMKPIYDALDGK